MHDQDGRESRKEAREKDRRIMRTRGMIIEAFLEVLRQKEYADITVIDIAEKANINRSTFYAHYMDKDDLLHSMTQEKMEALKRLQSVSPKSGPADSVAPAFHQPDRYYAALFEHLAEHERFYHILLTKQTPANLGQTMQEVLKESFYKRIAALELDQKLQVPIDILLDYIACATQGIIVKWLDNNRMYSPHYMALQLTRLSLLGVYKAMGMKVEQS
ncbi:TetR/AcrR family transcriptional regulator [Brevibacillus sp. SYP-B805]|uniref:TetR/AcrR family transcriptional regulator n=1 Tax=Brevibacillus sp. SYP-B805 TaxID=1578199 RepID=UPI0013EC1E2F|nr:TetR/AcrR family transcriptional regulator [Brevibacillus sp. SYP-B805]NGQ96602.1 TetR/AcrR family transcriptional regulator [Brevibacillus sp. SYP-B805]